jgi:hypothetical protein
VDIDCLLRSNEDVIRGVWCVRGECTMHSGVMVVMFIVVNCGRVCVCVLYDGVDGGNVHIFG